MAGSASHSAPGQALGYLYQFERATYRLLCAGVDVVEVGIEDVDDVSEHRTDGSEVREQDKSTVREASPLGDRSEALWKTLSIWVQAASEDPQILERSEFHLVTNGRVRSESLARAIGEAKDSERAAQVAEQVVELGRRLRRDLAGYGETVASAAIPVLTKLIQKIYVFDNVSPKFGGDLERIPTLMYFTNEARVAIFDQACGWVWRRVRECVEAGRPPRISREEFTREMRAIIRRVVMTPLQVLISRPATDPDVSEFRAYGFVRQLDWIDLGEHEVRAAIVQYVTAEDARMKWCDSDVVSEEALMAYEDDLVERWRLVFNRVKRAGAPDEIKKGQECFDRSMEIDSYLSNEAMPKVITCGCLHFLANFSPPELPRLGWHPRFEDLAREAVTGETRSHQRT